MTVAQRSSADRMIDAKGQTVTIAGTVGGTYVPGTGTVTGATPTSQTGKGVILPLAGYRKVDGALIVAGDETLLLSALNSAGAPLTEPAVDEVLTLADGTTKYTFVMVNALSPAGLGIIYDCVVRRQK